MALRGGFGGKKSKTDAFATPTEAQHQASRSFTKETPEEYVQLIDITKVIPDPNNRVMSKLSVEQLLSEKLSENIEGYEHKQKFLEGLQELAEEIKAIGLEQPIKVYKHGDNYKMVYGERRLLAHRINKSETIKAFVLERKPKNLRRIQTAENLQRDDLLAWERLIALKDLIDEAEKEGIKIQKAEDLQPLVNKGRTQCQNYFKFINLPKDIQDAMEAGKVLSIKLALSLADLEAKKRKDLLSKASSQVEIAQLLSASKVPEEKPKVEKAKKEAKAGRKRTRISLGVTKQTAPIQKILTSMNSNLADQVSDWSDYEQVQSIWDQFIKSLMDKP